MAMDQIPAFYPPEFATNWEHQVQQKAARLKGYATVATVNGKEKKFNLFGPQEMTRKTTRGGQTKRSEVDLEAYWLRPLPFELANVFDEYDEEFLGDIVLPTSETMQSQTSGYVRAADRVIIAALGGIRWTGELGTTPNALPNSQKVPVNFVAPNTTGSNSGLTLAKLIKAKSILGKNEAIEEGETPIFAYRQQQLDDLLNNVVEVKSSDYNQVKALYDGVVDRFMGFKFVKLELLDNDPTTDITTCFAYVPSGVKYADSARRSHMDILPGESHSLQIRTTAKMGASRTQDKKVVAVYCDESP